MKIECTIDEANEFIDRFQKLQEYLDVAREERDKLEDKVEQLQLENNRLQRANHDTSPIAQLIKRMVEYRMNPNNWSYDKVTNALNILFPDQKVYQIKLVREVFGISLKEAKNFIEGNLNYLDNDNVPF